MEEEWSTNAIICIEIKHVSAWTYILLIVVLYMPFFTSLSTQSAINYVIASVYETEMQYTDTVEPT